jgi:hypothetical protein
MPVDPALFNSSITDMDTGEELPAIAIGPALVAPDPYDDQPGSWVVWWHHWIHGGRHLELEDAIWHALRLAAEPRSVQDDWCTLNGDNPYFQEPAPPPDSGSHNRVMRGFVAEPDPVAR